MGNVEMTNYSFEIQKEKFADSNISRYVWTVL